MIRERWSTTNRFVCFLAWWFYESHAAWPHSVQRVYGFKEYQSCGRHVWVEKVVFWRSLYRTFGMLFVFGKKLWDRGEARIWAEKPAERETGM